MRVDSGEYQRGSDCVAVPHAKIYSTSARISPLHIVSLSRYQLGLGDFQSILLFPLAVGVSLVGWRPSSAQSMAVE